MTYVVSYRGLTVTCSDADAVDELANRAGQKPAPVSSSIHEAVAKMGELGQGLLRAVLNHDQQTPMPKLVLLRRMNLEEDQLTGAITAVSKPLRKAGFTKEHVLRVIGPSGHGGERTYAIVPEAAEEVRKGLGMK
jgi:hypothetical protein